MLIAEIRNINFEELRIRIRKRDISSRFPHLFSPAVLIKEALADRESHH